MKKKLEVIPGFLIALLVAFCARFIESILPIHLIGASVIALFIGMGINQIKKPSKKIQTGLKFTSKKILKFAIILLGASLSIGTILHVGKLSLTVMIFTLLTCFGGGYYIGKILGLDWKLSNLISAGTGICGGSAIAAIAPVVDADDKDIAYAMSATFLFDMAMIIIFPILGQKLGLSDMAYGLWTGTAVNDTSSVVAAGYAFSEGAGDFATMVKLTRTLSIIPTVLVFSMISAKLKRKENPNAKQEKVKLTNIIPWFILMFVAMAVVNSFGVIPENISLLMKDLSKFLMVAALAAIGMNTDFNEMKKSGLNPMIHGFIISLLVVIVAIAVEYAMGIV
ncbi:MAG: YeiH family protein [Terrisporobacter othiniensis]|uniref:YeiH family protein n=1 Tax=Terrisporobacter othiniensis TaxID=1577792 RepID=UPI002911D00A|nr:YeiH family protein [Terrisporobacter othiniensis]MDU6985071.1 YeiH family protein [Terrisporobacter othiniensis]